jgi:DNA-binding response OmpR family regulator
LKTTKVLVCDDDKVTRLLMERIVKDSGFTPVAASGGLEAIDAFRDNDASIVLLDWMMPGMDGLAVLKNLREIDTASGRNSFIVMVTAKTELGDIVEAFYNGADDFIMKPIDRDILAARLKEAREIVEGKQRGIAGTTSPSDPILDVANFVKKVGDSDMALKMLTIFGLEIEEHRKALQRALDSDDVRAAKEAIEKARDVAGVFGAHQLIFQADILSRDIWDDPRMRSEFIRMYLGTMNLTLEHVRRTLGRKD